MRIPSCRRFVRKMTPLAGLIIGLCFSGTGLPAAELSDLVAPNAKVKKIVGDCKFTEGPAYGPQGFLLFSDIPNDRVIQVLTDETSQDFLKPSGHANGLMFDAGGRLFLCQGGARQVSAMPDLKSKKLVVLADSFEGKKLNSPNDLALDAHGGLYFTDPRYGERPTDPVEQPVMGVYYIDAARKFTRVIKDLQRPNGVLVSPDGKSLYVAEPNLRQLVRYEITSPGVLSTGRVLFTGEAEADGGGPDGMSLDVNGNLYLTYNGIVVISPEGKLVGRIDVAEHPANCAFGGPTNKTLFITARTGLYSLGMQVAGMALQPAGKILDNPPNSAKADASANAAPARTSPDAPAKTKKAAAGDLTLTIPEAWKQVEVRPGFRAAQFTIAAVPDDKTDAELVVYHFGQVGGGGVKENVTRWIGQFEPAERNVKVLTGKLEKGAYTLVDLSGTYNKSIGPPVEKKSERLPGWRVLAAVVETETGLYYIKLDGPAKTVSSVESTFRASFGGNVKSEKETQVN